MLCQRCQKRIANVHFTQIINNNKVEMYLCEQCANEKSQFHIDSPFNIGDLFSGFIGINGASPYIHPVQQEQSCDVCGMTYSDFQRTGKLGCGNCYKVFGDRLKPILKRLHGNAQHVGKMPRKLIKDLSTAHEIEKLKEALNKAIQNEEYEKAAEIRDKIREIENKKN